MFFTVFILIGTVQETFAQNIVSSQHQIKGHEEVYSQFIPLYGTFSVQIEYTIPFEIHSSEIAHAGDAFDILVTANNPGTITTTFLNDGDILEVTTEELRIGEEKTIEIPESWLGQIFVMPIIYVHPTITGPATITPESTSFDTETTKQFQIFVDEDITTFDSIKVELFTTIKMKNGGNINLGIAKIPLGEQTTDMQSESILQEIYLKKIIPVNLHLQVKQGQLAEHVKVKANLSDSLQIPVDIHTSSVEIYVDGIPKTKILPNIWSDDIHVGNGTYNFQARFTETRDSENVAITYTGADSAVQVISVISNGTSSMLQMQCKPDQIIKDGSCVKKEEFLFGGGCLVATAAYGTELAPQVQILREIRDATVLSTTAGTTFMIGFNQIYYSFAPTVSDWERENPLFRELVRMFITPMILILSIMTFAETGSEDEIIGFGILAIILNFIIYVVLPLFVILRSYKKIKTYRAGNKFKMIHRELH